MQLNVNDQKVTAFRTLEKKVDELEKLKNAAEKVMRSAQDAYNNGKSGCARNMAPWESLGPLHVTMMKATFDYEQLNNAHTAATAELQSAKPVMVDEVIRAAREAIK